ncbi:acyl-CoA dehydrogenase family protein [Pseudofrankia inefficax]|uniref:Acyl-CoA dehydrogenase domain-containing protein n=1 Tax=Pseudofrankia inefficax (strain DSM 45817 / CECT 9037 / DDB 130130 / EuI1c) TaxID=298654 RepID=E3J7S6_PSEI1|nr:acyl-CoA dehydrogenase family protein [Pseudofrankia inefficax]ADP80830.1 acyl-CoA dehydrogenase domain-containing protein [Pseudofrankia inefficax]
MSWEFETDAEFQAKLDWIETFVREEVEPLDVLHPRDVYKRPMDPDVAKVVRSLQQRVRDQDLWACHLGPDLGGQGYGQLKLALMNEILGRSHWAALVFGTQAPDTGNAEVLAHYGTAEQKERYLRPLLDGEIVSCYSMTEPQGGSDPGQFTCGAVRDGDDWVINGWKFFSSHARWAEFLVVMVRTDPEASVHNAFSMFLVPSATPGVRIERNIGLYGETEDEGGHSLVHYDNVRVPAENLLGEPGQGFAVAQTRLGGGRVHHAMRAVGVCQRALDMMCERVLSRTTRGSLLADKQYVQGYVADSWAELAQFRLLVLRTAWKIDRYNDYSRVREDIAAVKILAPRLIQDIVGRAIQVHGALGITTELDLVRMFLIQFVTGFSDGPSEIHKATLSRRVLKQYKPAPGLWPTQHIPTRRAEAAAHFAERLKEVDG